MGFRPLTLLIFSLAVTQAFIPSTVYADELPSWQEPISGIIFNRIPAGCFTMGNAFALDEEVHYRLREQGLTWARFGDETPVHEVCLDTFWISRHEITADQWLKLMAKPSPSGQQHEPAAGVTWVQTQQLLQQLNRTSTRKFRLPYEAEWEYACRAGEETEPNYTLNIDRRHEAWYSNWGSKPSPQPVGQLAANNWGLYDMLGNVWEWTQDNYAEQAYSKHQYRNPSFSDDSSQHVIRGGSHISYFRHVRCSARGHYPADQALPQLGLRLVMEDTP